MKKIIFIFSFIQVGFLIPYTCRSQDTTLNISNFSVLLNKMTENNTLTGSFTYKGYPVNIIEYTAHKSLIGKFEQILWANDQAASKIGFFAIYNNKSNNMTNNLFNWFLKQFGNNYKDYKINDNKYCKGQNCTELQTYNGLSMVLIYKRKIIEIQEIK